MANVFVQNIIKKIEEDFGKLIKVGNSNSLFEISSISTLIYFRYSKVRNKLPLYSTDIDNIISEIDVIWLENLKPVSFFEVEHSTPIYSGLLRFNDVLLSVAGADNFNIVAQNERESKFSKEIRRPTFKQNKLIDKVTFLDYGNIYNWYYNLYGRKY